LEAILDALDKIADGCSDEAIDSVTEDVYFVLEAHELGQTIGEFAASIDMKAGVQELPKTTKPRGPRKNHIVNETGRSCGCCGEFRSWDEYYKNASHATGHKTICKLCDQAASVRWRQRHSEKAGTGSIKGDMLAVRHRVNGRVYEVQVASDDFRYAEVLKALGAVTDKVMNA